MPSTVRIPTELYETLREIKISLEREHQSAAPAMQDLVGVAIQHFINDWNSSEYQPQLLDELLKSRQEARSRMGRRTNDK